LRGVSNSIEGVGHHPLKTPPRKHKMRRFLTSFGMTNNGGGHSPPPTPPKRIFVVFGVSWEGVFCPFPPICHPEERSDEGSPPFNKGFEMVRPPTPPKNDFMPLGKS